MLMHVKNLSQSSSPFLPSLCLNHNLPSNGKGKIDFPISESVEHHKTG